MYYLRSKVPVKKNISLKVRIKPDCLLDNPKAFSIVVIIAYMYISHDAATNEIKKTEKKKN